MKIDLHFAECLQIKAERVFDDSVPAHPCTCEEIMTQNEIVEKFQRGEIDLIHFVHQLSLHSMRSLEKLDRTLPRNSDIRNDVHSQLSEISELALFATNLLDSREKR